MASKLVEKREELHAKQKALADIFAEAGDDLDLSKVKSLDGDNTAKAAEIKRRNDELTAIGKEVDSLALIEKMANDLKAQQEKDREPANGKSGFRHANGDERKAEQKSNEPINLGKMMVESEAFKRYSRGEGKGPVVELPGIELKTLFSEAAGFAPQSLRTGRIVDYATRPIAVVDVVPQTTTQFPAVVYMEETTFTNAAAETAEGGAYPEAAMAYTERSSPVRKIAAFLPVTDEQIEDVPAMQDRINNRLVFMLKQRLDLQILTGDGVAPDLTGVLNTSGIQTQALGADPAPDAIYKAMTKVRAVGFSDPNLYVTHPNNWQTIRLMRTADGLYIWGSPADPGVDRIWGIGTLQTTAMTQGTGLVGDFLNYLEIASRRGMEVQITNSHSDYFASGKLAVRADVRLALTVYRPAAFCQITNLV